MPLADDRTEILYVCAPQDEGWRVELDKHLVFLKQAEKISCWHLQALPAGANAHQVLLTHLNQATLILLFISIDFLNDGLCRLAMTRALKRKEAGEAVVIPLRIREVSHWNTEPFGNLQPLPAHPPFLGNLSPQERDTVLAKIAGEIQKTWVSVCKDLAGQLTEPLLSRLPGEPVSDLTHWSADVVDTLRDRYAILNNLLAASKWEAADIETWRSLCVLAGKPASRLEKFFQLQNPLFSTRFSDIFLNPQDIENLPSQDLHTIDQLWLRYSHGHFGFSIQKQIYDELGGKQKRFGDQIGWRKKGRWIFYSDVLFDLSSAPRGHLPVGGPKGLVLLPWQEQWNQEKGGQRWLNMCKEFAMLVNVKDYLASNDEDESYNPLTFTYRDYYRELRRSALSLYTDIPKDFTRFLKAEALGFSTATNFGHEHALNWTLGRILLMQRF